jgi:hypothetical protein
MLGVTVYKVLQSVSVVVTVGEVKAWGRELSVKVTVPLSVGQPDERSAKSWKLRCAVSPARI